MCPHRAIMRALNILMVSLALALLPACGSPRQPAASTAQEVRPDLHPTSQVDAAPHRITSTPSAEPQPAATPVAGLYTYTFRIDRSATPDLYYAELSYVLHLGDASNADVRIKGELIASTYDPASGDLLFSTDQAGEVAVRFASAAAPEALSVQKAPLKDNKAWAWSHGMDDNVNLQAQVAAIAAKGWRASLMLIAKDIDDTRDEGWILDKPALRELRNQGWSLADHSWDHNCDSGASADTLRQTMIDGYDKLMEIIASSDAPGYQVLAFAAPCFISEYTPVFADLLASGETTLRFNESQGNPLMHVDGADYTSGELTAAAIDGNAEQIGRDTSIELGEEQAITTLDWMAANKAADRHFWFNTLSHGDQEDRLAPVLDHAYTLYGPGGTDELWMAPSDEIYSYLLVRDRTAVMPGALLAP